jgi:glycosyltransferase involved in cell wall biosynthesis
MPTFNEEGNLPAVLRAIAAARSDCDVLVVDDGSTDRSADVARELGADVLSHPENRGYGAALVSGYRHALGRGYETVVQVDADGQHDPAQIGALLGELAEGRADMVIGSRMIAGGGHEASLPRVVGIHLFAWLGRVLTGRSITDPTSGFAAMNRRAVAFLAENTPDDFPDLNVLVALHRAGIRVTEVPVTMAPRLSGKSQMRGLTPFIYVPKMLLYLHQIYRASPPKERPPRQR